MATFHFADIRVDVRRIGPHEDPRLDAYGARLTDPSGRWIEIQSTAPRGEPRTTADSFDLAYGAIQSMYAAATSPKDWRAGQHGGSSDLELDATLEMAKHMELWLGPAVDVAESRWDMYDEGREEGIGPLEISGRGA
jgi:hypothetical protein